MFISDEKHKSNKQLPLNPFQLRELELALLSLRNSSLKSIFSSFGMEI